MKRGVTSRRRWVVAAALVVAVCDAAGVTAADAEPDDSQRLIGREVAVAHHLSDDEEFRVGVAKLVEHGRLLFQANFTSQEGAGRPQTKGTGKALSDPDAPLSGMRAFNRISGPDSNSCAGCHNAPYGIPGGGGDFVGNVFVLGQRFDFVTFDPQDTVPTGGTVDERGLPVTLNEIANQRATTGMFGAGYIEMLAREITADLQRIRDGIRHGESRILESKGIVFGRLARRRDGTWDTSGVEGLPRASILTATSLDPPTLVIRPWHQAGNVVSLREFTNNALNQHHGMQTSERFGVDSDPDGDGFVNELTRADVTALTVYQAVLPVPGQVLPRNPAVRAAIEDGRRTFAAIGCAGCHIPALPLRRSSLEYVEPNPYNPPTNLRSGEVPDLRIDLTDPSLPGPRLVPSDPDAEWVLVPVFTDFKLHDVTRQEAPPEPLDQNQNVWAPKFTQGNRRFLTKRLWGCANEPPYFHNGMFTTLREAVLAHGGEATDARAAFEGLTDGERDAVIEFLKSLQVLPPGTTALVVDDAFQPIEAGASGGS